jgi:hypothetical protein|nr:MAG TPA: hypothetical protein [Bacteriophage sp.]
MEENSNEIRVLDIIEAIRRRPGQNTGRLG